MRWPQPSNEDEFEELCLLVLQEHWQLPSLERYGHRGDRQNGVDLWDPKGTSPRRAVQCKHHHPSKTLPPQELADEVEKARGFRHPIEDFFVITTAKRSVLTADRVGEINAAQKAIGGFQVTVWYWDDVERFISRSPKAQELLNTAPAKLTADLVVASAQQIVQEASAEHASDDVAEIRRRIERGRLVEARELISTVRERRWETLSNVQRARVLTNLALIEEEEGRKRDGAQLLLRALDLAPDEEPCLANAVFAHMLLGDRSGAQASAREYVRRFPHSAAAWANVVQSLPPETTLQAARAELPPWSVSAPEVLVALAERAAKVELPAAALAAVREAVDAKGESPQGRYRIAQTWFSLCVARLSEGNGTREDELGLLVEYISEAMSMADAKGLLVLVAECRRLRGTVNDLLGNEPEASADLSASVELYPSSRGRLTYAQHLLARGASDDAISQLDRNQSGPDLQATALVKAMARWQRNVEGDRDEATREFVRLATECDDGNGLEALTHAVHALVVLKRPDEARQLLESKTGRLTFETHILWARVCLASGNRESAADYARQGFDTLNLQPLPLRRWLAIVFGSLGERGRALAVWERAVAQNALDSDTYTVIQLAMELGRDDIVLARGAALRAAGIFNEFVLQQELVIRERYNLVEALEIATAAVEHCPEDKLLRLRRSWLANRLGRNDLVSVERNVLPLPQDARGDVGRVVVHLLLQKDEDKRALEYAYEFYRHSPGDPDGLRCMRDVFVHIRDALGTVEPTEVTTESAVRVEERDGASRWFFLETGGDTDITRGEVDPATTLGQALLGCRVGATVVLSQGMTAKRTAVVVEIASKYARRMQQVFETFEIVVPDRPELSVMHVGDGKGGFDFAPVIEMLKANRDNAERAVRFYSEHPAAGLQCLAKMLSRNELEALAELIRSGKTFWCARGTRDEQIEAAASIATATETVIDLSAALTLFAFGGTGLLAAYPNSLITSQGTRDALRNILRAPTAESDGPRLSAGLRDGQLVVVEETPEAARERADAAETFLRDFERSVRIVPALPLADWDATRRELLKDFFGWHGAEVLALASTPGRALWCDDFSLAEIAKLEFSCTRVWTQGVAMRLDSEGHLSKGAYEDLSAKLLAAGYEFTSVNRSVLQRCGEIAGWVITKAPLLQAMQYVSKVELDDQTAAELALELLALLWPRMSLPASRENCLIMLLERLLQREHGRAALTAFGRALPRIFVVNPIGLNDARRSFALWSQARRLRL